MAVGVFMIGGCWLAPKLGDPRISNSIFAIIQEGQAYIYSGVLAVESDHHKDHQDEDHLVERSVAYLKQLVAGSK